MKLLIIGKARAGKDTLAEYFKKEFGFTFKSSSEMACEIFLFDKLKDKYGYKSIQECMDDRVNHRAEWFDLIQEYNTPNEARLAKEILKRTNCYVGMRRKEELEACKKQGVFDAIIWVDGRGDEDSSSITVSKEDADYVIENDGTLKDFKAKAFWLFYKLAWKFGYKVPSELSTDDN